MPHGTQRHIRRKLISHLHAAMSDWQLWKLIESVLCLRLLVAKLRRWYHSALCLNVSAWIFCTKLNCSLQLQMWPQHIRRSNHPSLRQRLSSHARTFQARWNMDLRKCLSIRFLCWRYHKKMQKTLRIAGNVCIRTDQRMCKRMPHSIQSLWREQYMHIDMPWLVFLQHDKK